MAEARYRGEVVKLDRGYPLVRLEDGELLRCEHATALVKGERRRAVIGDVVEVAVPPAHDKGVIEAIAPRTREFVRKDPTERAVPQVLAANFERVIVAQPVGEVNLRRLERELVLAFETGAEVTVVLTKADLADDAAARATVEAVQALAAPAADVLVVSEDDPASVEAVRALLAPGTTTVLIGRSGVGKSSLVNMLVGAEVLSVGAVREGDGKGRHTTVSREIVEVPAASWICRACGVWDCGTPKRASARLFPMWRRWPRSAASATAPTTRSRAAQCARLWSPASWRRSATGPTRLFSRKWPPCATVAKRRAA